jgi:hypothetical protein
MKMEKMTVNFSIDLEDTLENNKTPFIPVFNKFLEQNHPEALENSEDGYSEDDIEGWGFDPFNSILSERRNWEEQDEANIKLFLHGENIFYTEDEIKETKEEYGSIWPGFHPVMGNIFKGRPEEFPINDEKASEYFEELKQEFPESRIDIVTSRSDNQTILDRPDGYPISESLREGLDEYAETHGLEDAADELIVAGDKVDHENNYRVFFDDKPTLPDELKENQYQVVLKTVSNDHLDIPRYGEVLKGDYGLEENNAIHVDSVEEGFEAMAYIGNQIRKGSV